MRISLDDLEVKIFDQVSLDDVKDTSDTILIAVAIPPFAQEHATAIDVVVWAALPQAGIRLHK